MFSGLFMLYFHFLVVLVCLLAFLAVFVDLLFLWFVVWI